VPRCVRTSPLLAAFVCSLLPLLLCPLADAQVYKITDLGTLAGGTSQAFGLNSSGQVVGSSCANSVCHAFLWTRAVGLEDLGTLPGGGSFSIAAGINDLTQVAGSSDFSLPFMGNTHAFLWTSAAGIEDIGTLGCLDVTGANAINSAGQIVGTSTIAPCPGGGQFRAFLWSEDSGIQDLGTLPGGTFSVGNAINTVGWVAGYSDCLSCAGTHPYVRTPSGILDLGTLPGGSFGAATGINILGAVVGTSDSASSAGQVHAFLWTALDGMIDLGTLPGGIWSSATGVNDSGSVVGSADFPGATKHGFVLRQNGSAAGDTSHAFIWTEKKGMRDLNDHVVAHHSGWVLQSAEAINSSGEIVGFGTFQGSVHAFLLTPPPFKD